MVGQPSFMNVSIIAMLDNPRTWERVEALSMPEPNFGCILWLGVIDKDGYAKMNGPRLKGRRMPVSVSKLVLARKLGHAPNGFACHTCDVNCCINEHHLYDGTPAQNVADMYNRGRRVIVRDQYGKIT